MKEFPEFDVILWQKALALNEKAKQNNETLSRQKVAEYLGCGERLGAYINFALTNRNVLNCVNDEIDTNDGDRELALGDTHHPYQDQAAIDVMLKFAKYEFDPTIITLNGDILDFYQISSFCKDPMTSKRIFEEVDQVREFLQLLRDTFPKAQIIYKEGNHEKRLSRYILEKAPQLAELLSTLLIDKLHLPKLDIEYKTEPFAIGKLWHLHGDEKPGGSYNPEYITNVLMQYVNDHFCTFHYHRTQSKTYKRIGDRYYQAFSVGYLAGYMEYAQMNKWNQGFLTVHYDKDGNFKAQNRVILKGIIY